MRDDPVKVDVIVGADVEHSVTVIVSCRTVQATRERATAAMAPGADDDQPASLQPSHTPNGAPPAIRPVLPDVSC